MLFGDAEKLSRIFSRYARHGINIDAVQFGQGGPSIHFNSEEQKLYLCDFDVHLVNLAGGETQGRDGKFRVYRNGKLVFTGKKAADSGFDLLVNGEPCESVGIDCTEGDRMRLCYACTDDAGLRYEFPLFEILTWKWDGTERYPISGRPTVTWAE